MKLPEIVPDEIVSDWVRAERVDGLEDLVTVDTSAPTLTASADTSRASSPTSTASAAIEDPIEDEYNRIDDIVRIGNIMRGLELGPRERAARYREQACTSKSSTQESIAVVGEVLTQVQEDRKSKQKEKQQQKKRQQKQEQEQEQSEPTRRYNFRTRKN